MTFLHLLSLNLFSLTKLGLPRKFSLNFLKAGSEDSFPAAPQLPPAISRVQIHHSLGDFPLAVR